ncbi:alanine--tRNA ligase [Candidatus Micrarchaeota archaeon]|nr:alanine--tRNA ligase [Candidatus Micrarchaeota archaeon]
MNVDKNELRKEFAKDWKKHYSVKVLIERGFTRKQCKHCNRNFWSIEAREQCGDSSCIGYQFIGSTPVTKKLNYIDTWKAIEKYFTKHKHGYVKPYPTVARWRDDLYFTIASINDFQPYVVNGELEPPHNPLIVPQPCIRFPDISNVGVTGRHYTNFVMIGQHAFNTKKTGLFYWKEQAIEHDLNYLKVLGIPEKEIIFQEDVWVGGGNFGPCIEYFVRGLELGNCVFMQYEVTPSGHKTGNSKPDTGNQNFGVNYRELSTKVIDMGAGLERLSWITSGDLTSYESVFGPVIDHMKKHTGVKVDRVLFSKFAKISGGLDEDEAPDIEKEKERIAKLLGISKKELFETLEPLQALYASADHLKTILFSVTDGMLPSNAGGGYNLRMILRRVFGFEQRYGYSLDYGKIITDHADHLDYMFPHLRTGVSTTIDVIAEEQRRYSATKEKARGIVINIIQKAKTHGSSDASGANVPNKERTSSGTIKTSELITLYKSHGIPPEAVIEVSSENGVEVEMPGNFYDLVREGEGEDEDSPSTGQNAGPSVKLLFSEIVDLPKTKPMYYTTKSDFSATVLGIVKGKYLVLDKTAFYPEGGGQASDTGTINGVEVVNVIKQAGIILHELTIQSSGSDARFKKGQTINAVVNLERRKDIARHHTSAHILNAACRAVLGPHIWQGGSNKEADKAHLDVTHYRKITNDEIARIELKVNEFIMANLPIRTDILPRTVAESKYGFTLYQGGAVPGKELRIVAIGEPGHEIDVEACGGTHQMLERTGEIGCFKIVKREGVQDGIERIVYKCGKAAIRHTHEIESIARTSATMLSVQIEELPKSTERFFEEWKSQRKIIDSMSDALVRDEAQNIIVGYKGRPVMRILDLDQSALRKLGLKIAESENASVCLLNKSGNLICAAGSKSGVSAKSILEKVVAKLGGSGGGSERIAQGKVQHISMIEL